MDTLTAFVAGSAVGMLFVINLSLVRIARAIETANKRQGPRP